MADIFHEVEEDLRREKLNKLWARYGSAFLTVAVLAVVVTGGVVFWRDYQQSQSQKAAESFSQAGDLVQTGNVDGAIAAFAAISAPGGEGYPVLALFRQAGLLVAKGDVQGALAIYDQIGSSAADERLKAIARLRAAYAVADSEAPDVLKNRVASFLGDDNIWRFQAREIQAYADFRAGRAKEAGEAFSALAADPKAPASLRERATRLSSFMQGGAVLPAALQPTIQPAAAPAAPPAAAPADPKPAVAP